MQSYSDDDPVEYEDLDGNRDQQGDLYEEEYQEQQEDEFLNQNEEQAYQNELEELQEEPDPQPKQQQQVTKPSKINRTSSLSTQTANSEASQQRAAERQRQKQQIREGLATDAELDPERKQMWKMFGINSAAGKELFNLYRCHKPPQISYPKPKPMKNVPKPDVRKPCPQKTLIEYPSLQPEPTKKYHQIDFVPRRKREEDIRREIEAYYKGRKFFRPKIRGLDRKKLIEELQVKFKYLRGGLPKGAELPAIDMRGKDVFLSNEETKTNAIKRTHNRDLHFMGLKQQNDDASTRHSFEPAIELNMLFDQIVAEIEERQVFLEEIEHLDEPKLKQKIKDEIIERVSELQKVSELKGALK